MKRTKLLALTLVVAIMMMGAGYAYWTQDLTIENNISTGTLDVVFDNEELTIPAESFMGTSTFLPAATDGEYNLELDLVEAYPGADFTVSFDLDNEGTLGAHVRDFKIAAGDINAELVLVRSYKVGSNTVNVTGDKTLETVLTDLNTYGIFDQGIFVDVDEEVNLEFVLEIDPAANTNLQQGIDNAIAFTINATAHQYNDIQ